MIFLDASPDFFWQWLITSIEITPVGPCVGNDNLNSLCIGR